MAIFKDGFDSGKPGPLGRRSVPAGFQAEEDDAPSPEEQRLMLALDETLKGDDVKAKLQASQKLMDAGFYTSALDGYQTIIDQHPDREALCLEYSGDALMKLGQYENAAESFDDAIVAGATGADEARLKAKVERALELLEQQPMGEEVPEGFDP